MAWTPQPVADWVHAANRGDLVEFRPDPEPFVAKDLVAAAIERTGYTPTDTSWMEPLDIFCTALDAEANLTPLGRWATQRYLARLLDGALQIEKYEQGDPAVAEETVAAPIFITGAPRTGTTAVHRLLAATEKLRATEAWEVLMPVPPPQAETHSIDPRIRQLAPELMFPQSVAAGLAAIHSYSARMPKECLSAMAFAFRTEEFVSRYHVPSYAAWLRTADMTPAYELHRRVLRILQRRMPTERWVLKSPVHLQAIPELVATYPDASFVITHREPEAVLASVSSLVANLRSAFSDQVDPGTIGRYHLELYSDSLNRLVDHVDGGVLAHAPLVHLAHGDIVTDAISEVQRAFEGLEVRYTDAAATAVATAASVERDDAPGRHHYDLDDFGIDPAAVTQLFDRYRHRFLETR